MRSGCRVDLAHALDQPGFVHCPDLIQQDLTRFSLESNRQAGGVGTALGRHRGYDDGVDMAIHFVRRNDEAGAGLADFTTLGGVRDARERRRTGRLPRPVFPIPLRR